MKKHPLKMRVKDLSFLLITLSFIFFIILIAAHFFIEEHKEWRLYSDNTINLALPNGKVERCLTCHKGIKEVSPSHPIKIFGCVSCHGGNGLALSKQRAHKGLRGARNPASLSFQRESCGKKGCHIKSGNLYRSPSLSVPLMPMATKAGEIAEVAFAYGWQKDRLSRLAVQSIADITHSNLDGLNQKGLFASKLDLFETLNHPVRKRFMQNCLKFCHLNTGFSKQNLNAIHLEGCAACHTPFRKGDVYKGNDKTINKKETGHAPFHELTTAIPFTQCNACHNQGIHSLRLKFYLRGDIPREAITDPNADRKKIYYIPQARYASCEVTLDCIDCHTRNEVMGDGHLYGNKASAQTIRCYNCHGTIKHSVRFKEIISQDNDGIWASHYMGKRFPELNSGDLAALTDKNEPMINLRQEKNEVILYSKISGNRYIVPQVKESSCLQDADKQRNEYCHACHDVSR